MKIVSKGGLLVLGLITLLSFGVPVSANAYDYNYQRQQEMHHHWWKWHHHDEANRAYPRYGYNDNRGYGYNNQFGHQNLPADGQGMINHRNPNLFWACDSDGHHCHWARR